MSDTKKVSPANRDQKPYPAVKHARPRRCDFCGNFFPPEEISEDCDENGTPLGWFCEGCI